jgi:hypothetical protein
MAATTENQSHGVTSTTSDHVATNVAPDVCFTPDKKAVIPHDNTVNTALATEHTTPKTQVSEGPVVRQGDAIGPSSTSGDGGACGKGVASGTCMQEARIATGSPNVQAEGGPVGRKTDPGTSNHGNTSMQVKGGDPSADEKSLDDAKKEACTLLLFTPEALDSNTHITCKHGRVQGKDKILEVATPCSLTLTGKRWNAKKQAPPECEEGDAHTEWEIKRENKAKVDRGPETKHGDTVKLSADWLGKMVKGSDVAPGLPGQGPAGSEGTLTREGERKPGQARDDKGRFATGEKVTYLSAALDAGAIFKSAKEFWECWHADKEPTKLEIVPRACSGSAIFTVLAYPGEEVKFKIDDTLLNRIRAIVSTINAVVKGLKYIANVGGAKVTADIKLLEGFYFEAGVKWVELTKDQPGIKKYKHNVDREWTFTIGVEQTEKGKGPLGEVTKLSSPRAESEAVNKAVGQVANLAAFGVAFGMEIIAFVNAFIPGAGTMAARVINWLGASATAGIDAKFTASISATATLKAGDLQVALSCQFAVKFDFYLNVKVEWGKSLEISGGAICKGCPTFSASFPVNKRALTDFALALEKGIVSFGFRGVFKVDTWFFKTEQTIDYVPEWAKVEYGPYEYKPLGALE